MMFANIYVTIRTVVNGAKNSSELFWARKNAMKLYNRVCDAVTWSAEPDAYGRHHGTINVSVEDVRKK